MKIDAVFIFEGLKNKSAHNIKTYHVTRCSPVAAFVPSWKRIMDYLSYTQSERLNKHMKKWWMRGSRHGYIGTRCENFLAPYAVWQQQKMLTEFEEFSGAIYRYTPRLHLLHCSNREPSWQNSKPGPLSVIHFRCLWPTRTPYLHAALIIPSKHAWTCNRYAGTTARNRTHNFVISSITEDQ